MPVDTKHPQYAATQAAWKKIRDCLAGEDAVKAAGEAYLPKPGGMGAKEYTAFKDRALFFGAASRTVSGLLGAMFRKEPDIVVPDRFAPRLDNIDLAGTSLDLLSRLIVDEVLGLGRHGVLTDMTADGRAYLVNYTAESITNWRRRLVLDRPEVDQVVLHEAVERPASDGFGSEATDRYRVLELDTEGFYIQRLFERGDSGVLVEQEPIEPRMRGRRMNFIPFNFFGPGGLEPGIGKAPIKELVDVNISHYQTQADLEHGAHWTSLPTPWVSGLDEQFKGPFKIGSQMAWALPQGAQVGMLEFTGAGLQALENRGDKKEQLMVLLGARLLEDQKRAAETAESKRLQYSGENSILAQIANTVSAGLRQNIAWAVRWDEGRTTDPSEEEVSVALNTDFFDAEMSAQEMLALMEQWQAGGISHETYLWNLKRGERLPPGVTPEAEIERIGEEGPLLGALPPAGRVPANDGAVVEAAVE